MSCLNKLLQNIADDCTDAKNAVAGISTKAVIINVDDIDLTALTLSGAVITNLSLLSGATGYSAVTVKRLHNTASEFAANDAGVDKYNHSYSGRIFAQGRKAAELSSQLKNGRFIVIVETSWGKGTDDAFAVFGTQNGLVMTESTFNSNENDGGVLFVLGSEEGFGEEYQYQVWDEGTYTSNKAKFDALFAE
ncbi:MAG: hypothetical protein DI539_16115 [Flavobacterium psychrophilum]|nr:MAG: hypothetical protein DI539_16115 [Flavobacterium psychrophilum]